MTLAAVALASTERRAEILRKEDMLHHDDVRYYLSTAGGERTRPVVLLAGDHFG
jgi:hypothetical protein